MGCIKNSKNNKNGFLISNFRHLNQTIKMAQCSAYKANGHQCEVRATRDGLCGIHNRSKTTQGPHNFEKMQLKCVHAKQLREVRERIITPDITIEHPNYNRLVNRVHVAQRELMEIQRDEIRVMEHRHYEEVMRTGVNPDREANERRRVAREARQALMREEFNRRNAERLQEAHNRLNEIENRIAGAVQQGIDAARRVPAPAPAPIRRELRDFAADGQNVHRTETVRQVRDIIAKIRTVPVPEEYRWKRGFVSPTVGEIMAACNLTAHAGAQLFNKYVHSESIYNIEEGIYGKVLDHVWQFIKTHPDKADLCKIMKQELEDNIGMCAQGNLSRICNVLAGYMDGIGSQESLAEKLGRLFPPLMDIDDDDERRRRGEQILTENAVPREQWDNWLMAL